jgi:BirA family biotin operon repressor/biotin-[acetyl-CoA-carboxylase] ligase
MSQKYPLIRHVQLDSTQLELRRLLEENPRLEHMTTVTANTQTKGRGRGVSVWQDEEGKSALFSTFIMWPYPVLESFLVNKWVCHVLATTMPKLVQYKWPNDLMVGNKKLGGILIENRWEGNRIISSMIGLGINVQQSDRQLQRAISLEELKVDIAVDEVIEQVLNAFKSSVHWITNPVLLDRRYDTLLWGRNTYHHYRKSNGEVIEAFVHGVDTQGRLRLKTKKGQTEEFDLDSIQWIDPKV